MCIFKKRSDPKIDKERVMEISEAEFLAAERLVEDYKDQEFNRKVSTGFSNYFK